MWIKNNKWLLLVLLFGAICRSGFVFYFFSEFERDPDAYKQIAENVASRGQFGQRFGDSVVSQPTAFRPPLYPLTLSLFVTEIDESAGMASEGLKVDEASVALLHIILSVFTIFCAYLFARQMKLCDFRSSLVALLVTLDPIGLRQSSLVMTETMAVFFATLGLCLLGQVFQKRKERGMSLLYGLLCGLFSMCRPTFLIWGGLIFMALLLQRFMDREDKSHHKWWTPVFFFCGIVLAITPWTVRNYFQFGKPIFATTHGGYTIYLGNNDSFYDYLRSGKSQVWDGEKELRQDVLDIREASTLRETKGGFEVDEVKKDRLYYDKAMEVIRRRPADFAYACFVRVVRFWSIVPNSKERGSRTQTIIGMGSAFWYGLLFLAAITGLSRIGKICFSCPEFRLRALRQFMPAVLLVVAFQGLHLLYWSNMRMRAPLVAVIALLAVLSLVKSETLKKIGEDEAEKSKS